MAQCLFEFIRQRRAQQSLYFYIENAFITKHLYTQEKNKKHAKFPTINPQNQPNYKKLTYLKVSTKHAKSINFPTTFCIYLLQKDEKNVKKELFSILATKTYLTIYVTRTYETFSPQIPAMRYKRQVTIHAKQTQLTTWD